MTRRNAMKILAIHDAHGNITASVVLPENAPPGAVAAEPGQMMTEVEAEVRIDPLDGENYQRLIEVIQNFRVDVKTEAKLVRKRPPKGG